MKREYSGGTAEAAAPSSGGGLLDPQSAPARRRDVAVDHLARIGGDEEVAAVTLVALLRIGLILDRGLRHFRFSVAAHQREEGRRPGGGDEDGAAADAGIVASLTHERLLNPSRECEKEAAQHERRAASRSFRMILNCRAVNRQGAPARDALRGAACLGCGAAHMLKTGSKRKECHSPSSGLRSR